MSVGMRCCVYAASAKTAKLEKMNHSKPAENRMVGTTWSILVISKILPSSGVAFFKVAMDTPGCMLIKKSNGWK